MFRCFQMWVTLFKAEWAGIETLWCLVWCVHAHNSNKCKCAHLYVYLCWSLRGCLHTKTTSLMNNWHSLWESGTRDDIRLMSLLHNLDSNAQNTAAPPAAKAHSAASLWSYWMCCVLESYKLKDQSSKDVFHEDIIFKETKEGEIIL